MRDDLMEGSLTLEVCLERDGDRRWTSSTRFAICHLLLYCMRHTLPLDTTSDAAGV